MLNKDFKSVRYEWMRKDLRANGRRGEIKKNEEKMEVLKEGDENDEKMEYNIDKEEDFMKDVEENEIDVNEIEGKF